MSGNRMIRVDRMGHVPLYRQVIQAVEEAIREKGLRRNDRLPSVNKVCLANDLSRDTVLLAYEELKKRGIIYSIPGKGYFVKTMEVNLEQRVFLLFDELNAFKEEVYQAFIDHIDQRIRVDIFFHHFNLGVFRKLVEESRGNYNRYIIMPTNMKGTASIIRNLPMDEVIILDQTNEELKAYPSIHQDFIRDMYEGLLKGKEKIDRYRQLVLIYPGNKEPIGMVQGFEQFVREFGYRHAIISSFEEDQIEPGTVFIIPNDKHLVHVIEQSRRQGLVIGVDVGIISYNDIPLKKVTENGITTISTGFAQMGKTLAAMLMSGSRQQIRNPAELIMRNSL